MKDTSDIGTVVRYLPDYNYEAIWKNNITVRLDLGEIKQLPAEQSEFYDISLGTWCGNDCKFCFVDGTLIETISGKRRIEDLKLGEQVFSYNHQNTNIEVKNIQEVHERDYKGDLIVLELENGFVLKCTPNHKIFTKNRGYVPAEELTEEDDLIEYERRCIFCGKDISTLKSNAIICGDNNCIKQYKSWKKDNKANKRYCEICGKLINDLPGQRKICLSPECIKEQKRRKYNSTLIQKVCSECGEVFYGTAKQRYCSGCKKNLKKVALDNTFITYAQIVLCKTCKKPIDVVSKIVMSESDVIRHRVGKKVCESCKEASRKLISERMKVNNPSFNKSLLRRLHKINKFQKIWKALGNFKGVRIYPHKNYLSSYKKVRPIHNINLFDLLISRKFIKNRRSKILFSYPKNNQRRLSQRMKLNNPMKSYIISEKVGKSLKNGYLTGRLKKIKGKDHWLWKGNRAFNKAVRIELRNWVKAMFKKAEYTCQVCGKKNTELHVHHKIPLRNIINDILTANNITTDYLSSIEGSEIYFNILNEIVKFHEDQMINVGIVVCPQCHSQLDSFYKRKI